MDCFTPVTTALFHSLLMRWAKNRETFEIDRPIPILEERRRVQCDPAHTLGV